MFTIPSHIRFVPGEKGGTIFNFRSKEAVALNMIGSSIWQHLEDGDSFVSIVEALAKATGADVGLIERDTWIFVRRLIHKGLVFEKDEASIRA